MKGQLANLQLKEEKLISAVFNFKKAQSSFVPLICERIKAELKIKKYDRKDWEAFLVFDLLMTNHPVHIQGELKEYDLDIEYEEPSTLESS